MKAFLYIFIVLSLGPIDPARIGKINAHKKKAEMAFKIKDYKTAIQHYQYLTDSLNVTDENVQLNLAHALYLAKDSIAASQHYTSLLKSTSPPIRSTAGLQMGVLKNRMGKSEEALQYFKQAIKDNPANTDARYNYEMLKKKLNEKNKQENQQGQKDQPNPKEQPSPSEKQKQEQEKNKDQESKKQGDKDQQQKEKEEKEKKDQQQKEKEQQAQDKKQQEGKEADDKKNQQQEQQGHEGDKEKKDEPRQQNLPSGAKEKLEQMKISEETAKMLLEAMKNQEIQYLQQKKRQPSQRGKGGKPDW